MAYDADRSVVVLFGGRFGAQVFNDTWEWDGEYWTQMADIGPSARYVHALVYDTERKRTVLFGGSANGAAGDTWQWNGEDWTQISDEGPAARSDHTMAFDTERKRIVVFGGISDQLRGDTWEWDGQAWTQQQDVGPSPRRGHSMAYDSKRKRTVLFGGLSQADVMGDTWEWNGSVWTQVDDVGPNASVGSAMAYDGENVLIYGGVSSFVEQPTTKVFGDTWEWDGKHWTQRQDIGPGPRWRHGVAFDSKNGCVVLFGGLASFASDNAATPDARRDTWESSDSGGSTPPAQGVTLQSFVISPQPPLPAPPGSPVTAQVSLSGPAPAVGLFVSLNADLVFSMLPSGIQIPPNATGGQVTFAAPPGLFPGSQLIQIRATLGSVTLVAGLMTRQ
jgi:hypothetical protein